MIINKNGSIFDGNDDVICHQVNCLGIMGGGIAARIREKFPQTYGCYHSICKSKKPEELMGRVLFYRENGRVIANCFAQENIGSGVQTDYEKLKQCFEKILLDAIKNKFTVAIPYKIGCGLAGGDWEIVEKIIKDVFEIHSVQVTIYKI